MHKQIFGVPITLSQSCAHLSFRSTDSSGAACLLPHQLIDLVILERRHSGHIEKCHMAVWEGAVFHPEQAQTLL